MAGTAAQLLPVAGHARSLMHFKQPELQSQFPPAAPDRRVRSARLSGVVSKPRLGQHGVLLAQAFQRRPDRAGGAQQAILDAEGNGQAAKL